MTTISTHTDSLYLIHTSIHIIYVQTYATEYPCLTEVAGEGGPDLAPQKSLLSQKFRHLMRYKKYLEKNFLSCLVSEIQLFVYIFG